MPVNLHNYETFFLLYADNELTAQARKAVEEFVLQHPQLQEEFDALLSARVPAQGITISKISLLKLPSGKSLEEAILLQIDGALDKKDWDDMQQMFNEQPELQQEFELLQATRLPADTSVVYTNKEELYRYDSKVRVIGYRKYFIAAAILLLGLFIGVREVFFKKESQNSTIVQNERKITPSESKSIENKQPEQPETVEKNNLATNKAEYNNTYQQKQSDQERETYSSTPITPVNHVVSAYKDSEKKPLATENSMDKNRAHPHLENINNRSGNETVFQTVLITEAAEKKVFAVGEEKDEVARLTASKALDDNISIITPAVHDAHSALQQQTPESEDYVFAVKEERINRTKVGAFIQKVKSDIEEGKGKIKVPRKFKLGGIEINI